jgi:hypothetical protein
MSHGVKLLRQSVSQLQHDTNDQQRTVMFKCCILRGLGGDRIMAIVPGGTELELQLRRGVGQVAHTCNNPHVKCTGVYCA